MMLPSQQYTPSEHQVNGGDLKSVSLQQQAPQQSFPGGPQYPQQQNQQSQQQQFPGYNDMNAQFANVNLGSEKQLSQMLPQNRPQFRGPAPSSTFSQPPNPNFTQPAPANGPQVFAGAPQRPGSAPRQPTMPSFPRVPQFAPGGPSPQQPHQQPGNSLPGVGRPQLPQTGYPGAPRPEMQAANNQIQNGPRSTFPGTFPTRPPGTAAPQQPPLQPQQFQQAQFPPTGAPQSFAPQENQYQNGFPQNAPPMASFSPANPTQQPGMLNGLPQPGQGGGLSQGMNYPPPQQQQQYSQQQQPQGPPSSQFPPPGFGSPVNAPMGSTNLMGSQPPPFMGQNRAPGPGMFPPPLPGQGNLGPGGQMMGGFPNQPMANGMQFQNQPLQPGMFPPGPGMPQFAPPMPGMPPGPPFGPPMAGMPPPGAGGMPMGPPGFADPSGKKAPSGGLTNDSLPSVIDVLEKDMAAHASGFYESRLNAALPPLVTTGSKSVDYGNTVPELLRSSLYVAPCTANLLKDSGVPFVLHMQPMAELPADAPPIPIVNHGDKGPVRCNRCKAYMSPYMKFIDGGRKFQCPFCFIATDVPQEYFAYLDSEGRRVDVMQRPELCLGTYEFLATKEYCRHEKLPEPPAFIFMIDVSYRAVSSGFVQLVCQMLRSELESLLPVEANGEDSKLRVGIATFSDSVHFFNLKSKLSKPNMMTVNDFSDMFVPLVDGFLVKLDESGEMLDSLLDYIPKIFAESRQTDTILYPVIQSGMRALEAAGCPGKLFVFNFSLPTFDAPGKLKNREDRQLLGTDKEKVLLKPQIPDYTELGKECVALGCSVDLFLFPNSYIDTATLGEVSRLTGGQVYKYAYFQADKDGARFLWDLRHNLKRTIAFDAVMRVRTNAGIRPTDYFGNMYMPNTTEVHLASIDSEKAILAEIKHDDKLEDKSVVHIQVALLYTSLSAQRRVRVLNMALMASGEFGEMYRCAEIDVVMNFMVKNSLKGLFEFSPAAIREGLAERTTKMLVAYRKHCSNQTPAGQLVLPESLKLLPIYTSCLARNDIVSGTGAEVGADDRSWLILHANSMAVEHTTAFLYPRYYVLNEPDEQNPAHFRQIRTTGEKMQETGAYLLENGVSMFLWLGSRLENSWVEDVFGVQNVAQVDIDKGDAALSTDRNATADRLRSFIERIRNSRPIFMRLTIVRQRDKLETWFRRFLVEDKGSNTFQQSYVEYIYYLYNSIRDELDK